ncbi:ATP-binding protein [Xinfangfangia sp. CPCC 101601]|uniref:histidine kinase n=1 Tax=Pseudogemmobacter lacusdianii TaxID=3069608 RepID=A0ABU0VUY6_9RHOB|nr:ATP-binding protein [Xinfangfangia sp. CPCC 101601]MDQ2065552.1 ATP-binding protein [Xinfangfangia sp. CPCC 101601]
MRVTRGLSAQAVWILSAGLVSLGLALVSGAGPVRNGLLITGLALVALTLILRSGLGVQRWHDRRQAAHLTQLVGQDVAPCFSTDEMGRILFRNAAALSRFGDHAAQTLVAQLHEQFAAPSAVLFRLQSRAANSGAAREDLVTRRGHLRLSVHRLAADRFLWRLEEFQDRSTAGRGAEGLSLPMVVVNRAGVVLFSNEAMRKLLGERPKRLDRIFPNPRVVSGEEVQVFGHNGPLRAVVAEVEGLGDRREVFLLPSATRNDEDTISTDFESVPVALMKFAADGRLRSLNLEARRLLGDIPMAELSFHDLFEDLGRPVADWLSDVVSERLPAGSEVLRVRRAGEDSFVQVQLRRIVEHGRSGALAVLADATALKKLEAQFTQSQKMQAIGQLAGGVAHDFNNLLTAILGHCDLLLLHHGREDADFADLEQIRQNANRAAGLVSQLLAFSRKQTLTPETLDLPEVLSDLTHLLNRLVGEKVQLQLAHDPSLAPIRADKRQLEQVLMNLVVNARDAMPDGGTIRIETEAMTLPEPLVRERATIPAGHYAMIRVLDTGCGIPTDKLEKIFDPFFTTKKVGEGTGLGLSTVYGIVKQSGGYIFVASEQGRGTVFEIFLPAYTAVDDDETVAPVVEEPRRMMIRTSEGVVLLVEDEAPVRAFASRALRLRGYTVLEAESAEEALRTLADPALEVDVFVTDVVMPGMDGPTWVKRALETRPDVKVIFVSGYAEDVLSADQARIPNSIFLPKPFSLNDLTQTVQGQLH